MTQKTEKVHIIDISKILIERLEYIKIHPKVIAVLGVQKTFNNFPSPLAGEDARRAGEGYLASELSTLYPDATFNPDIPADLVWVLADASTADLPDILTHCKNILTPSGLLMFGGLNLNYVLQDIGDFLHSLGFTDIVMDRERLSDTAEAIFAHAFAPKPYQPASVPINAIKRRKI